MYSSTDNQVRGKVGKRLETVSIVGIGCLITRIKVAACYGFAAY